MIDVDWRKRVHRFERHFIGDFEAVEFGDRLRSLGGAALADEHDGIEALAACLLRDDSDFGGIARRLARERSPSQARRRACGSFRREVEDRAIFGGDAGGDFVFDEKLGGGAMPQLGTVHKRHVHVLLGTV